MLLSRFDIHSLFDVSIELAGLLGGGFAGAYTLGMFTRRANSPGVAIGIGCEHRADHHGLVVRPGASVFLSGDLDPAVHRDRLCGEPVLPGAEAFAGGADDLCGQGQRFESRPSSAAAKGGLKLPGFVFDLCRSGFSRELWLLSCRTGKSSRLKPLLKKPQGASPAMRRSPVRWLTLTRHG